MNEHTWKCECGESFRTLMEWDGHVEVCDGKAYVGEYEQKIRREVACVNALAGIDDPEAFMRDVKHLLVSPTVSWVARVNQHLKGGDA